MYIPAVRCEGMQSKAKMAIAGADQAAIFDEKVEKGLVSDEW